MTPDIVDAPVLLSETAPPPLLIVPAATPVRLAPESVIVPPAEAKPALSAKVPVPLLSASATRLIEPVPVVVIAALIFILLLACKTRLLLAEPVAVVTLNALLTVILLVACKVIVLPAAIPAKLPVPAVTLNTLVKPASSANASVTSLAAVKPVVLVSAPLLIVMLSGSSSKLPPLPCAALKLTLP